MNEYLSDAAKNLILTNLVDKNVSGQHLFSFILENTEKVGFKQDIK